MAKKEDFLRSFVDDIKDQDMHIAEDGTSSAETEDTFDTGSHILNAALSGSLWGGVSDNKVTTFGGESTTGKTFFCLAIIQAFLRKYPDAGVMYFDSEAAVTQQMLIDRGIDPSRVVFVEPNSIQDFKHKALQILMNYEKASKSTRPRFIFVLDSLGALPSNKEIADASEGKDVSDMTMARAVRSAFRTIRMRLARERVPFLLTQHVYANISGYGELKKMSGGGGVIYASDAITMMSKAKDIASDKKVRGVIITVKVFKSRLSRENTECKVRLDYTKGLDRYYGLLEFGAECGIFEKGKKGNRIAWKYRDQDPVTEQVIYARPEEYFTDEVMADLESSVQDVFKYGSIEIAEEGDDDDDEGEEVVGTNDTKVSA